MLDVEVNVGMVEKLSSGLFVSKSISREEEAGVNTQMNLLYWPLEERNCDKHKFLMVWDGAGCSQHSALSFLVTRYTPFLLSAVRI